MGELVCTCEQFEIEDLDILSAKMDANIMFSYDNISDVIVVLPNDDNWYKIIGNAKVCHKHKLRLAMGFYPKGTIVYMLPEV